jgi:hypothetical protein
MVDDYTWLGRVDVVCLRASKPFEDYGMLGLGGVVACWVCQ